MNLNGARTRSGLPSLGTYCAGSARACGRVRRHGPARELQLAHLSLNAFQDAFLQRPHMHVSILWSLWPELSIATGVRLGLGPRVSPGVSAVGLGTMSWGGDGLFEREMERCHSCALCERERQITGARCSPARAGPLPCPHHCLRHIRWPMSDSVLCGMRVSPSGKLTCPLSRFISITVEPVL